MADKPKQHGERQRRARVRSYDSSETRLSDKRFYNGARWRSLRKRHLRRNPLCKQCLDNGKATAANHVDHIIDRKDAPHLSYATSNLQSLCASCHSRKTIDKTRRAGRLPRTRTQGRGV